jgi:RecA-family ATPase
MNPEDRAARYLAAVPVPMEGERNAALNRVAYATLERFDLPEPDFTRLLSDWIAPAGLPDREVATTLASAFRAASAAGVVGSKAAVRTPPPHQNGRATPAPRTAPAPGKAPTLPPGTYDLSRPLRLPEPIAQGAVRLLEALYGPDDGVRIAPARIGADGREVPEDAGLVLPAKTWLAKLQKVRGRPGGLWQSTAKTGVYVAPNPTRGPKDTDVTEHRWALLEFDNLPLDQQFTLYSLSNLPVAALIHSGGKSLHAWVKVDATDKRTFSERVGMLYAHFAPWHPDAQNKNPSRFSRLPDVVRFNGRQELLGLHLGCSGWDDWIAHLTYDAASNPRRLPELLALDTAHDPNCVVGFSNGRTTRFLCRGKAAWIIGPSGIGKSSLITEFAVAWALGKPAFSIAPVRPLKSVIVQGENDDYDLAEMVQGIVRGHALEADPEALAQVTANVLFHNVSTRIGQDFIDWLHTLVVRERPDLLWVDPLLSFAGIDVSKQDQCSTFLRTQLQPVLEETGTVLVGVHHTGKPKPAKDKEQWSAIDHAYSGLGSSELVNWARAVLVLRPLDETRYCLTLAKRGRRAAASHPDGEPTTNLFLEQARTGIAWRQIDPPEESAQAGGSKGKAGGRPSKVDAFLHRIELRTLLLALPEDGVSGRALSKQIQTLSTTLRSTLSDATIRKGLFPALNDMSKLTFDPEKEVWRKGPKL